MLALKTWIGRKLNCNFTCLIFSVNFNALFRSFFYVVISIIGGNPCRTGWAAVKDLVIYSDTIKSCCLEETKRKTTLGCYCANWCRGNARTQQILLAALPSVTGPLFRAPATLLALEVRYVVWCVLKGRKLTWKIVNRLKSRNLLLAGGQLAVVPCIRCNSGARWFRFRGAAEATLFPTSVGRTGFWAHPDVMQGAETVNTRFQSIKDDSLTVLKQVPLIFLFLPVSLDVGEK